MSLTLSILFWKLKMKTLNNNEILEEVFSVLIKQLEPWKVAHFWAISHFGQGDYLQSKYQETEIEDFEKIVHQILAFQDQKRYPNRDQ